MIIHQLKNGSALWCWEMEIPETKSAHISEIQFDSF